MKASKNTSKESTSKQKYNPAIDVEVGHHKILIGKRYGLIYTLNDIFIAVWFIIGSICFFNESTKTIGVWLFLLGSIELLIRPVIRIIRNSHLKRISNKRL